LAAGLGSDRPETGGFFVSSAPADYNLASVMEFLDIDLIVPLHEPRSAALLAELKDSMMEDGWNGRALLVIEREADYLAWTGSHRLAAAKSVGISHVPCHVVSEASLADVGADSGWGHVEDSDRLRIIQEIGDEDAIAIMWSEGRD
jgi:hypothetical protein